MMPVPRGAPPAGGTKAMLSNGEIEVDPGTIDGILSEIAGEPVVPAGGAHAGGRDWNVIPLLQRLQAAYGFLPRKVLKVVSERTGIPPSRLFGVATFYAQFYLEPHGKHTVRCCRGTACHVRGGRKIINTIKTVLGIEEGETTPDMLFSLETVACLGACALSPVMVVDKVYYGDMTAHRAEQVLKQLRESEQ
jgi:NADH-quinone oxidoreductase subunit E